MIKRKIKSFLFYLILLILLIPRFLLADGGMMRWPKDIRLDQSAQNAIVAWNGIEEIIILSNDIESNGETTILRMIPLPSNPSEIKEGSFESFEKLVEIMNKKIVNIRSQWVGLGKGLEGAPSLPGVEITFQKKIGAHDITVVKVNDLNYFLNWIRDFTKEKQLETKEISSNFKEGVANYLKRDIRYFVFDVIEAGAEKESIKPLIYKFNSDFLYYPLLITGISEVGESRAKIDLFIITQKDIVLPKVPSSYYRISPWFDSPGVSSYGYPIELTETELKEVSLDIVNLLKENIKVSKVSFYGLFNEIKRDLMIYPYNTLDKNLGFGNSSSEVKNLQKILINEGVWNSRIEATGFFGPITKEAVIKFQERYASEILGPLGLTNGTGFVGPYTQAYLKKLTLYKEEKVTIFTDKNEYSQGETVKIIIKNNSANIKWILLPLYTIERFDNENWIEIKRVLCPCGALCKMATHFILSSYATTEFQWDQKETWCSDLTILSQTISKQVPPGKYRVRSYVSDPHYDYERFGFGKLIYSNEFTIR